MSYTFSTTSSLPFDQTVEKVTEELKKEGFGVLTQIDVKETLKKKLDVDFRRYLILGACNPQFAYKALQAEEKIGVMLPCNVVVSENDSGEICVDAVDPIASMKAIQNEDLGDIASQVQAKLKKVIQEIN